MAKSKTHRPEEHYRGVIRSLKQEVKRLTQRLRYYEKREHLVDDMLLDDDEDEPVEVTRENKISVCPKCKHGLIEIDLGRKLLMKCSNIECTYRCTKEKHG